MSPIAPSNVSKPNKVNHYYDVAIDDILGSSLRKRKKVSKENEPPRAVKKRNFKESSDEEEDQEDLNSEKNDDSYYELRKVIPNKEKKMPEHETKDLNSYEKMIEQKRAERIALLKSMEIDQIKEEISEAIGSIKQIKKNSVTRSYKKAKSPPTIEPIRRSKRLANLDVDFSESALEKLALKNAVAFTAFTESQRKSKSGQRPIKIRKNEKIRSYIKFQVSVPEYSEQPIPAELTFEAALKSASSYEECVTDLNVKESKYNKDFFSYDKTAFKNMTLNDFNICKVVPARITSAAWYPSKDDLVIAAGDKFGNLGLWKIQDSETAPHLFKVHAGNIPNMQFNLFEPVQIITSSYDGTLRCGDLVKHTFSEIYETDGPRVTWFDFLSPSTFLVSHSNGEVAVFDRKTDGKTSEKRHACHEYTIKTINVHPTNKNVFVTADNKKYIRIWDLRKLQKKPIVELLHHKKSVNSAYFSSVTGNSLLTTSLDDSICIFDSTKLTQDIKLTSMIHHNNFSGRWLSIFRATWLPNSDDLFAVGIMEYPRRIEIFDKDLNKYYNVVHDNLTSVTSVHRFHPYRNVLAGGNSAGKLFVFT